VDSLDATYRRGIAEIHLRDFNAAIRDLETVTARDRKYDFHRAIALLAHAYANSARPQEAGALFEEATGSSTASETYLNYAEFLAARAPSTQHEHRAPSTQHGTRRPIAFPSDR
jgi:hypothetical protein